MSDLLMSQPLLSNGEHILNEKVVETFRAFNGFSLSLRIEIGDDKRETILVVPY